MVLDLYDMYVFPFKLSDKAKQTCSRQAYQNRVSPVCVNQLTISNRKIYKSTYR